LPSQRPQPRRLLSYDQLTLPEGHACHPFDQGRRLGSPRRGPCTGRASGMRMEFLQSTAEQREQAQRMIKTLRANADKSPELQVEPDGLETSSPDDSVDAFQASATKVPGTEDALVDLFRRKFEVP